ncbi:MAG: glycerol-3-phosphate dehydrogenase/oxidase [Saprospiraceae bacterium]
MLSAQQRSALLQQLQTQTFDLVVIGGGITGAGIALDAASRGMQVALLEMQDFASGTSSKSTKLIHGGLRYLKQLEINLVREVGRERAVVHHLAPHLVTAEKMLLPLIEGGTYGKWATSFGLYVYDLLADVQGTDRRRMLTRAETLAEEPLLRKDLVVGGGLYAEYRTDDARLTIEIIKTAARHGARCLNYSLAEDFLYNNGKIEGVRCRDLIENQPFEISAQYVINAAGPWVDQLRQQDKSLHGKRIFHSKGVHLVLPYERLPLQHAVYFDVPDGRMIFAIPRQRTTYVGTTDTPYEGSLDKVLTTKEDVYYILNATNQMFPNVNLTMQDVESSWAGLRPLIFEEGKSASEMSRKDEIFESASGLISIAGGKLTGYRKMAEKVVNRVADKFAKQHGRNFEPCKTKAIKLGGAPFEHTTEVIAYKDKICQQIRELGLPDYYTQYLVANYGKQTDLILNLLNNNYSNDIYAASNTQEQLLIRAELQFCLDNELVFKPMDFFNRRTGRLYFNIQSIEPNLDIILQDFKMYFGWNDSQMQEEKAQVQAAIQEVSIFS